MATRMQQRRGTATQWTTANPILNVAEIGYETDTNKFKIGDGTNHWDDLNYFVDGAELSSIIDGAPAALDTLNELAAAMGDDPAFLTTIATNLSNHQSDTTSIHGIDDTAELATKAFAASLLTGATKTNITITGDKTGLTITAENGVADSTTDNLTEGSTNKYFTDERAQDAVGNSVGTGLSYNDTSGAIGVNSGEMINKVMDAVSGNSYGLIGNSTYLDVINTNGYHKEIELDIAAVESQLETDGFAKLASPSLTGTPTAPTATAGTNTTQVATTAFVTTAVSNIIDSAPGALDTLNELAAALGDDASYASTITTALGNKQDKVSGVSDTEIGYLDGVTSAIQTQLDAKIAKSLVDAAGDLLIGTADNTVGRLAIGTSGYLLTSNGTTAEWSAAPATGPTAVEIIMGVY